MPQLGRRELIVVHIGEATYGLLRDRFDCEPRGTIDVKGKGPMRTWFLLQERFPRAAEPELAAAATRP